MNLNNLTIGSYLKDVREHPVDHIKAYAAGALQSAAIRCAITLVAVGTLSIVGVVVKKITNKEEEV